MDPNKPLPPAGNDKPTESNPSGGTMGPMPNAPTPAAHPAPAPVASGAPAPAAPAPGVNAPSWSAGGASPMPASTMGGKPKKKGLLIGLIVAIAILLLGGGAAAAYYSVILPNKPENILKAALANSLSDKMSSVNAKGTVSIKEKESNQTFSVDYTAASNDQGVFDFKSEIDAAVTKATFEMRSADGKDFYMKVGGLEGLPELLAATGDESAMMYAPMIDSLNDQWIEITESMIKNLTGGETLNLKMSDADRQKLVKAYQDHEFITLQEKLADEKIEGKDSHHMKIAVSKEELKGFVAAVKDAKVENYKLTQDDVNKFNDAVKNVDFSKYPVELWISKDEKLVNQVKFRYSDKEMEVDYRMTMTDFNKPVTVTKPSDPKSILDVIGELFGGSTDQQQLVEELEGSGISL